MSKPSVAVVLAGGAGLRMGGGKPLRAWGEVSLVARALALAQGYADDVAVAVRDAGQLGDGVGAPLLFDHPDVPGPLAGLASALAFARARGAARVQLLACDMPVLPADLTRRLAAVLTSGGAVALPASNGRLHPVCGLWSVEVESTLSHYLAQGRSSLRGLAETTGLAVADWGAIVPDPFVNLNTLAELQAQQPRRQADLTRVKATPPVQGQTAV
jgi:molybdopterin-guanine dinucleotide biosynthesis protein A